MTARGSCHSLALAESQEVQSGSYPPQSQEGQ